MVIQCILETERLRLREFTTDDTQFILELLNSPGWLEFIGDRNIKSVEQAKVYLENGPIKSYRENGFGLSLVETKDNGLKIGMCGIIKRDNLDHPDIGFAFLPQYTGNGYAFEIAMATLTFAFNTLKLPVINGITLANNERSIRLLAKIGLKFIKPFHFPNDEEELMLFSTRE